MNERLEDLKLLIEVFLKGEKEERCHEVYQALLREVRPTREEFDYIDQQIALKRGNARRTGAKMGPGALPQSIVRDTFRNSTPLSRIYFWFHKIDGRWKFDERTPEKAYIMACLSEAAYLHLAQHELDGKDRYQLYPSAVLEEILRNGWRVDVRSLLPSVADIPIEIVETRRFIYIVYRISQVVVVAVRGTAAAADWLINVKALKSDNGNFHRGFYEEALNALPLLLSAVGKMHIQEETPLYFTGHSLGGAVAGVLTRTWGGPGAVMMPYVFGAPRFAAWKNPKLSSGYGYVEPFDLVPHLPPRFLGFSNAAMPWEMVPAGSPHSGLRTLLHWLRLGLRCTEPHQIEGYRANLGDRLGEKFIPKVYVEALSKLET